MLTNDRRSGRERRSSRRFQVETEIEWESGGARKTGMINDVSFEGCFVLTGGAVEVGSSVRISLPLADGMKSHYSGKVANSVAEIGFGMRYDPMSASQREVLVNLVKSSATD